VVAELPGQRNSVYHEEPSSCGQRNTDGQSSETLSVAQTTEQCMTGGINSSLRRL
jgi:hypothetical protein